MPEEAGYFVPAGLLYQSCLDSGADFLFEHSAEQLLEDGSGNSNGRCLTWGHLLGKTLAAR